MSSGISCVSSRGAIRRLAHRDAHPQRASPTGQAGLHHAPEWRATCICLRLGITATPVRFRRDALTLPQLDDDFLRRVGGPTYLGTPTAVLDGMTRHVVIQTTGEVKEILANRNVASDGTVLHRIMLGSIHGPRLNAAPVLSCRELSTEPQALPSLM